MSRKTRYVIMGLLSEQPLTGYQIKQLIDIRFRFFWNESYGQIYPELKQMVDEGLIEALSLDKQVHQKQTYALTSAGLMAMKQWLVLPVETETYRLEILVKMYFASLVDPQTMIHHIDDFKTQHQKELMILNMFRSELEKIADNHNHQDILSVISLGIKTNQAYLDWCDETKRRLEVNHETQK